MSQKTNPPQHSFAIRDATPVDPVTGAGAAAVDLRDDAVDLPRTTRAIRIAVAGILKVTMKGGEIVQYPSGSHAAGFSHPMEVTRVWDATTADGIYGEY